MLSVESQMKALITVIVAPVIGFIADKADVGIAMLCIGILLAIIYLVLPRTVESSCSL